jgi:sugar phosphate isomerase/epimerase
MSDEELVKMARLAQRDDRMATGALYGDLADRIEALTAKLAKAVKRLREIAEFAEKEWVTPSGEAPPDVQNLCDIARATLAEIEGSNAP